VAIEIFLASKQLSSHAGSAILIHMSAQDGFAQTARAAVDEDDELVLSDARALECLGIVNFLHRLNLGEVVSTTDCAKVGIELRGLQIRCGEIIADIFIPRVFEVEIQFSQRSSLASCRTRSVLNNAMPQPMSLPMRCG